MHSTHAFDTAKSGGDLPDDCLLMNEEVIPRTLQPLFPYTCAAPSNMRHVFIPIADRKQLNKNHTCKIFKNILSNEQQLEKLSATFDWKHMYHAHLHTLGRIGPPCMKA